MYTHVLATDVSFLNNVRPWLPDFVQKEVSGPLSMAMAIGFAVLVVGGIILLVRLAFNQNQHPPQHHKFYGGFWVLLDCQYSFLFLLCSQVSDVVDHCTGPTA